MTTSSPALAASSDGPARPPATTFEAIQDRILWLAVRMIHEANHLRPNPDGVKVGGHQASSASVVSILTALYMDWLRPQDLVSIKPHASPAYHATRYLLGDLDRSYLPTLRAFGGLQSYPSRTKDPDRVDFSTGSVGLGAVAPLFAALADRYLRGRIREASTRQPERRFIGLIGDAELDEGNVWEAILDESTQGLGNVTLIVDLNRQSLDRVVPGIHVAKLRSMFQAAGWGIVDAKYGKRLTWAFAQPDGAALRARIDEMSNEEYQALLRVSGPEVADRLISSAGGASRSKLARLVKGLDLEDLPSLLGDLGGHDVELLLESLATADADRTRPTVLFAYTVKGFRLPFAGDALNHSALLHPDQMADVARRLGADPEDPWAALPDDSPGGALCRTRGEYLRTPLALDDPEAILVPEDLDTRIPASVSTQQVFGDALGTLARVQPIGGRIVTASPDVAVSTNLGGWINRVGVYSHEELPTFDTAKRLLTWTPKPVGQHIELGISEMNLFMLLGQLGLSHELLGTTLVPIGTVYDPFIARGLDALIYSLYVQSRFILAATPSGITLAPEGGAHQSTVTPSLGIELPGLHAYEPAFGQEAVWCLLEGIQGCIDGGSGFSTYLRLSTRAVDQSLARPVAERLGLPEWRRQVLAGGYRLIEARAANPALPADAPTVNVVASGAIVTEAVAAVRFLLHEEVAANLIVVTSAERLAAEVHGHRLGAVRDGTPQAPPHLSLLIPAAERRAPMVTVMDGASHAMSFIGSVFGAPVVPLGMDRFGQSGTVADLYGYAGIDREHIIEAGLLALELAG